MNSYDTNVAGTRALRLFESAGSLRTTVAEKVERVMRRWLSARTPILSVPLDDRILRDIGLTRHGVPERVLAAHNEARSPRRMR